VNEGSVMLLSVTVVSVNDGATGATALIVKSDIEGAAPNEIIGFKYVGAVPVIVTLATVIVGVTGGDELILKSLIVERTDKTIVGLV
jgi:hypothetical protein